MAPALSLAGRDGPGRRALPVGEFLHPVPLLALAILAANDWWLKGGELAPAWLTGKLSDVAGVVFFPLLCTALVGTALHGLRRVGADVDPSLNVPRLVLAVGGTGALMIAIKLAPSGASAVEAFLGLFGLTATIAVDPTDLVCLPVLWVPWRVGRREIARLPLGRLEVLVRRYATWRLPGWERVEVELSDLVSCGADVDRVRELARAIASYADFGNQAGLDRALEAVRRP